MHYRSLSFEERYKIYGLVPERVAQALLPLRKHGLAFVKTGVEAFAAIGETMPTLESALKNNRNQTIAALVSHFEQLLTLGLDSQHADRLEKIHQSLLDLGTDARAILASGAHVFEAASKAMASGFLPVSKQSMIDLAILQRLIACDTGIMLAASFSSVQSQEKQKNDLIAQEVSRFSQSISVATEKLHSASTAVESAARTVASTAADALQQSRAAADAAEQGTTSLTTSAASTQELSHATSELLRRSNVGRDAVEGAETAVARARDAITNLKQSTQKIDSIAGLISSIAEQTNLLALNATIEAARAGDAGRGFAVVAQEVKALANETSKATREIVAQIAAVQSGTDQSVDEIGAIHTAMTRLSQNAGEVATAVDEQNALTSELTRNLHETVKQVMAAGEGYSATSGLIEKTSAESERLQEALELLSQIGVDLKWGVEEFSLRLQAA
jgi:methyl-accepting chemotaxis protein